MATIGRNKAVADLKFFHLMRASRVADMVIRAHHLPCRFRNRLLVLLQWAWAYLTFDKGARLITRNFQSEHRPPA
jgi:NADH dehydrogenase